MPAEPLNPTAKDDESLTRLMLNLLLELAKLILPIAAVAWLPPLAGLVVALCCTLLTGLFARLGWRKSAETLSWLLSASVMGFAFAVFGWMASGWGVPVCAVLFFGGLAAVSRYEQYLGLAKAKPQAVELGEPRGDSAWGGADLLTPEGERVRTLNWGEIAMGGPTYATYLFPDGVLLEGLGASVRFSSSGRYFAAPLPSRERWGLLILDRQEKRVYRNADIGEFWELDEFTDEALTGRHSPLVGNQGYRMALADLLRQSEAVELVAVGDLWLEPGWQQVELDKAFPPPAGAHRLRGISHLPASLREQDDPTEPLRYPALRLELDGELSELLIHADEQPVWRADGQALVCRAVRLPASQRWPRPLWLWQAGAGWRQLSDSWVAAEGEPALSWAAVSELGEQTLRLTGALDAPQLDQLGFGYALHSCFSSIERVAGHDAEGRIVPGESARTALSLLQPLVGDGRRGEGVLLSQPLQGEQAARFDWLRDSRDGRLGAYRCQIGDWQLDGEWLLDHRVSDCGRYLALVVFAEAPAAPSQVCVADVQTRRLLRSAGQPLVARLLDFTGGVLSLAQVLGRLGRDERDTPLRRCEQAAPAAASAARFLQHADDSRLYYRQLDLHVSEQGLQELPNWRLVTQPQVANADGDFVLPAPGGQDAAWFFGAQSEYRDHYLRERHPRGDGCLLTASGLAVANLAPSLIWSEDGRYLALTRYIPRMSLHERVETDQWHLLLLDLHDKTLRDSASHMGCMPQFLRFDASGIEWRVLPNDWEHEGSAGEWQVRRIALSELLPRCGSTLSARGSLWLSEAELARAGQWQRLPSSHLQPWRNMG
ncbi:hypothetical protein A9179_07725 [Pseudomonas alcaligenes]|uniref:Uncharacterized protein n=1 Tax=Aquipseudomonas alcaligenes TaxID=43263 RepID=A0ABR7RXU7_AQUAC|nr:hypothetical protein [Pseudomonas alcaligenes]MBC9250160.1 hypothetical protein [Pseudomonas alcaligenes]